MSNKAGIAVYIRSGITDCAERGSEHHEQACAALPGQFLNSRENRNQFDIGRNPIPGNRRACQTGVPWSFAKAHPMLRIWRLPSARPHAPASSFQRDSPLARTFFRSGIIECAPDLIDIRGVFILIQLAAPQMISAGRFFTFP